jgi:hypothetical protein
MKKFLLVVLVLGMALSTVYAQEAGEINFGARAGALFGFHSLSGEMNDLLGLAGLGGLISIDHSSLTNFSVAIFGSFAFTNNLSLQVELMYMINQGIEITLQGFLLSSTLTGTYSSLDLPILLRYSFLNSPAKFGVLAGPHVSLPLGYFEFKETGIGLDTLVGEHGVGMPTFGITAGLFGGFPVGPGRIVGDARYIMDFTYLFIRPFGEDFDVAARRGISIGLGYEFTFRRR